MAIDKQLPMNGYDVGFDGNVEVDVDFSKPVSKDFSVTDLPDGGVEVDFDPSDDTDEMIMGFADNLAEALDSDYLSTLSSKLVALYERDELARKDWHDTYKNGLDLLGLKIEERSEPWKGACGINHPLLAEATVRFQSQQIGEMFPAAGPVRTKIVVKETPEVIKQSIRIKDCMNFFLTEEMEEYREETDKLLFTLPLAGSGFKKTYWDESLGRPVSEFVPPEDLCVGSGTKSFRTCRRLTHILQEDSNEIRKMQRSGFYMEANVSVAVPETGVVGKKKEELVGITPDSTESELVTLLEMHLDIDLEGFEDNVDGVMTEIALPYVVTIDKLKNNILSIRRNWLEDDENRKRRQHFTHYQYVPGLGFYGLGLIHLIGGIAKGATSMLRQLIDAGTLSNLPGGFKSRGLRIKGDNTPIAAGEWRDVDVPAGKISDNLFPMPYGEPSQVLAALLGVVVEEGRRFASLTDISISSMNNEAPVGTTLALLERNLKVMTAISARIHSEHRRELKILQSIIVDHYDQYPYEVEDETVSLQDDFDGRVDILPVSDPNSSTMAQRIMTMQTALQLSERDRELYTIEGRKHLHRRMLRALEIPDVEDIIPPSDEAVLLDPVTENMHLLNGSPVQAFMGQDHQAHIQVHMLGMQDPKIQQILEQSPQAQASMAASMAHITQHVAFEYRNEIEASLGVALPPEGESLPPEVEVELSRLIAQAAERLFNRSSADVQEAEVEEKLQDPVVQDQMKNTAIKELEAQTRAKAAEDKTQMELAKLVQKHESEVSRLEQDREIQTERIRAQLIGDMLEAASRTEGVDSNEKIKVAEFIIDQIKSEGESVREALKERVATGDKAMREMMSLINEAEEAMGGGEGAREAD